MPTCQVKILKTQKRYGDSGNVLKQNRFLKRKSRFVDNFHFHQFRSSQNSSFKTSALHSFGAFFFTTVKISLRRKDYRKKQQNEKTKKKKTKKIIEDLSRHIQTASPSLASPSATLLASWSTWEKVHRNCIEVYSMSFIWHFHSPFWYYLFSLYPFVMKIQGSNEPTHPKLHTSF